MKKVNLNVILLFSLMVMGTGININLNLANQLTVKSDLGITNGDIFTFELLEFENITQVDNLTSNYHETIYESQIFQF